MKMEKSRIAWNVNGKAGFAAAVAVILAATAGAASPGGIRPAGAPSLNDGYANDAYAGFEELDSSKEERKAKSWWYSVSRETAANQLEYALGLETNGFGRAAIKAYEALVREWPAAPESAEAQRRLAGVYTKNRDFEQAFDEYEYLLDYYPGLVNWELVAKLEYGIAVEMITEERRILGIIRAQSWGQLRRRLERAVRRSPSADWVPDALISIARLREKEYSLEEAVLVYDDVISRFPGSKQALQAVYHACRCRRELVASRAYNESRRRAAFDAISRAVADFPDHPQAAEMKGWKEELEGKLEEEAWGNARFYDTRQRTAHAAVSAYESFLRSYPDSSHRAEAEARIEAIKGGAAPLRK